LSMYLKKTFHSSSIKNNNHIFQTNLNISLCIKRCSVCFTSSCLKDSCLIYAVCENTEEAIKMDYPEKLTT
jgi:hypothetical protein